MSSFFDNFLQSDNVSEEVKVKILKNIVEKKVKKGAILQHKGDLKLKAFYVKEGLLRTYTIDEKGKEHIFMFAPEDWIASDIESNTENTPAVLFIDALEDSEIEVINEDMLRAIQDIPQDMMMHEMNRLMRRIAVLQRRVIMLMSATAQERYEAFLKKYPQLPQRLPQKMIASYLGITPEALSKIRGEIARS